MEPRTVIVVKTAEVRDGLGSLYSQKVLDPRSNKVSGCSRCHGRE
jgi:cytochrome c553